MVKLQFWQLSIFIQKIKKIQGNLPRNLYTVSSILELCELSNVLRTSFWNRSKCFFDNFTEIFFVFTDFSTLFNHKTYSLDTHFFDTEWLWRWWEEKRFSFWFRKSYFSVFTHFSWTVFVINIQSASVYIFESNFYFVYIFIWVDFWVTFLW